MQTSRSWTETYSNPTSGTNISCRYCRYSSETKRSALPLVLAYCMTTYKSQGQPLNKVVVDLKFPNETDEIAAIYVPLSRVKRLVDLAILRLFDYKVLLMKPNKSQIAEIERLDQLYTNTQSRFSEWFE
ncbi:unnamed protein product [Adineta ricciae]|uniref:UvrD-like helicase C-terminal domain-containing protein n=1 Tax=Adineta ricciae TaxID=249248 RepID=A0A816GPU9_ADIRI|nr:unnamed protein product [Adineta ricciae]CAF1677904.1 unnamed protein product [Adineta ricciae]